MSRHGVMVRRKNNIDTHIIRRWGESWQVQEFPRYGSLEERKGEGKYGEVQLLETIPNKESPCMNMKKITKKKEQ